MLSDAGFAGSSFWDASSELASAVGLNGKVIDFEDGGGNKVASGLAEEEILELEADARTLEDILAELHDVMLHPNVCRGRHDANKRRKEATGNSSSSSSREGASSRRGTVHINVVMAAVLVDDASAVQALVTRHGFDANQGSGRKSMTPACVAASRNKRSSLTTLVALGADLDKADADGR